MTTDDKTLTEQIARALAYDCEGTGVDVPDPDSDLWCVTHDIGMDNDEWCQAIDYAAAAVLPIIREAQAEALRDAAMFWSENPDEVDDETPGDIRNWMRDRADQIEKETP